MSVRSRPNVPAPLKELRVPFGRRATVVGAGSFGTAVAVLLARGGLRTTLQARTPEQAERLQADRINAVYLPGVELPSQLRVGHIGDGLARAEFVFLGVPSREMDEVIAGLRAAGLGPRASLVSLAKGLVPPDGLAPTIMMRETFGKRSVACIGGPAHAREMVHEGAGLVAASANQELANALAQVFIRAGVVCEQSDDPVGVELAGIAKNAAALASGATERQGLNAAGAAAGHIFAEVWRYAETRGARPESMIGLAGTGDLVATTLAPQSRNRRAGEMLADGIPGAEILNRIGQAVESFETVPLLARALQGARVEAPVLSGLARLIAGDLPLDDWVALVRTTVPPPPRWRPTPRAPRRAWERTVTRARGWFGTEPARSELPPGPQ
jgi:glycerol-3-phosphate dehydrogenase (NAD(P)+)